MSDSSSSPAFARNRATETNKRFNPTCATVRVWYTMSPVGTRGLTWALGSESWKTEISCQIEDRKRIAFWFPPSNVFPAMGVASCQLLHLLWLSMAFHYISVGLVSGHMSDGPWHSIDAKDASVDRCSNR